MAFDFLALHGFESACTYVEGEFLAIDAMGIMIP